MTPFFRKALLGVAAMGLAASFHVHAATVNLTGNGMAAANYVSGSVDVNTGSLTQFVNVPVGGWNISVAPAVSPVSVAGTQSLLAWCVEVTQVFVNETTPYRQTTITAPMASGFGALPITGNKLSSLNTLIALHYDTVLAAISTSASNAARLSAAFQLAIWEVVSGDALQDTGSFSSGNFQAANRSGRDTMTAPMNDAQQMLASVRSAAPVPQLGYNIVLFTNDQRQDVISLVATPLPGAALLFASALGLGGLARRARARRAVASAS